MAFFAVTLEKIAQITAHPNADRLEIATLVGLGFQFCIRKGEYQPGDSIVYFPIDSLLPPPLINTLSVGNMLAGAAKNRVKTVQLRGQISQGLVCRPETVNVDPAQNNDLTQLLGVTKYEPPELFIPGAILHPLPHGLGVYDIEGADRYVAVLELLLDLPVLITEKLEGTNHATVKTAMNDKVVCQRGNLIVELPEVENTYWKAARTLGLLDLLEQIPAQLGEIVALRGEMIGPGIQKNIYGCKRPEVRLFDVKVGHKYLDAEDFLQQIPPQLRVPVLNAGQTLRQWLAGRTLQEASNGKSSLSEHAREGIVVRPMHEMYVDFGDGHPQRLILKQRSPLYLAKEE